MKVSTVASVLVAALATLSTCAEGVISINIASDGPKMSEQSGLAPGLSGVDGVPASSWNDIVDLEQTEAAPFKVWDGEKTDSETGAAATWKFKGFYGTGNSPDVFRRRWSNTSGAGEWKIDLSGIPFKKYDIICYMNWDGNGTWSPVSVNGVKWTYDSTSGKAVKGSDSWGESKWSEKTYGPAVLGENAMRIEGQVGEKLTLAGNQFANVCAIQIVESTSWNTTDAISFNLASSYSSMSDQTGLDNGLSGKEILASSWNDLNGLEGAVDSVKMWNGKTLSVDVIEGLSASWTAKGAYGLGSSACVFRRGWYDARNGGPWSLDVTGIPFEEYDVYVYMSWDGTHTDSPFWGSVKANGVSWTYDATSGQAVKGSDKWGYAKGPDVAAVMGENAFRIPRLFGSTLKLSADAGNALACAVQIVKSAPADYVATGDVTTKEIDKLAGEGEEFSVEVPAGRKLILCKNPLVCSKLTVICKGDLVLDTDHEPNEADEATLAKIDLSAVRRLVFHGWQPTARVVSVNIYSEKGEMATGHSFAGAFAGVEIPSDSWNDMPASSMTGEDFQPKVWDGTTCTFGKVDGLTMSWNFVNVYGWGTAPEPFRRGWLTQGEAGAPWTISFAGIPFAKYDVICYFNWDGVAPFWANQINSVYYIGDENGVAQVSEYGGTWGMSGHSEAAKMGVNAYRLSNQTSPTLTLSGAWMANLCAIQIVEHVKPRKYLNPLVFTIR